MKIVLGLFLILIGLGCAAFWVLFMSWSHSYSSPGFQRDQGIVVLSAVIGLVGGVWLIVSEWRRPESESGRRASEEPPH